MKQKPDKQSTINPSALLVQTQKVQLFSREKPLRLSSGRTLAPIDVAYETYGTLSPNRDNAILIFHALSGDAHVAGRHGPDDPKPGWWDLLVGPGKAFDTNRYFVICANNLGGCMGTTGPSSVNPDTGKPYGLDFPIITISDIVDLQVALLDHLGISRLLAVTGGSLGGMAVLDWAVRHPQRSQAYIPIATTARLTAQSIAFNAVGRNAISSDKNFRGGDYYHDGEIPHAGLAVARMVGHITYLSEEAMHEKFGRRLQHDDDYQYDFSNEFSIESYLNYQGSSFVDRFDANTYLYFSKAMDYFDLARLYGGSIPAALRETTGRFLVISFKSDWLFPPRQSQEIVNALISAGKDVTYCDIDCPYGHDSFLLETEVQTPLIQGFLNYTYQEIQAEPGSVDPLISDIRPCGDAAKKTGSIFTGDRLDHRLMIDLIAPDSSVLDLGCGDGTLLCLLQKVKNVRGMGVTLGQEDIVACARSGVRVIEYDIDKRLDHFPDKSYDYVVLSQTLQVIRHPERVLRRLLRIGTQVIISFPNFAYWKGRLQLAFTGRAPVWKSLPYTWYDKPEESVNYMSIRDMRQFVHENLGARLVSQIAFNSTAGRQINRLPNLRADEAIFVIAE